jgi:membrane-anchored protein YejM (alkaline phosphatase superfamily)
MPLSVQAKTPVECNQIDNEGGSSLYQTPSAHRRFIYKEQLKHIDQKLHELYNYISNHYDKNEVLVTLISDHGNAFNVDAGQPFMSDQRTNVPLMIYGAGDYESSCHEKIETIDYGHILCKLAGIQDQRLAYNDGQLPAFFGGDHEKTYVFSQSLFPERNYAASIITDDYKFYFQSKNLVSNDCRINISDGMYCLVDKKTELILTDPVIAEKCLLLMQETLGSYLDN